MLQPFSKLDPLPDFAEGTMILIDKPKTWTSFDVVKKIRVIIKTKIGHAGTLDPLATGLMIVCTGKFTKRLHELQGLDKEYEGIFTLGASRPSYDEETEIDKTFGLNEITDTRIYETAKKLTGSIMQLPPVYSAIRQDGVKLYKKARKGQVVEIKPRPVKIHTFDITAIELPNLHFRISCSKGTYIRSIAHDFGKLLNNGGYLHELKRTKVGQYRLEDAWNLQELAGFLNENRERFIARK